jgi:hypothetical protein
VRYGVDDEGADGCGGGSGGVRAGLAVAILACFGVLCVRAQNPVHTEAKVSSSGETKLLLRSGHDDVAVRFTTRTVPMPKLVNAPSDRSSACTSSHDPCILPVNLRIVVGARELFIPYSAYADLGDVSSASLKYEDKLFTLTFIGGDASESYIATLRFSSQRILAREIRLGEDSAHISERTIYYQPSTTN